MNQQQIKAIKALSKAFEVCVKAGLCFNNSNGSLSSYLQKDYDDLKIDESASFGVECGRLKTFINDRENILVEHAHIYDINIL